MKFCRACGKYVSADHPRPETREHLRLWGCGGPKTKTTVWDDSPWSDR